MHQRPREGDLFEHWGVLHWWKQFCYCDWCSVPFFSFSLFFFKEGRFVSLFRMKSSFIEPKPSGWTDLPVLSNWIWTHCNSQHGLKWPRKFFGGWNMEKIIIWTSYFEWMYPFSSLWLNYLFSFSFSFFFSFFLNVCLELSKGNNFSVSVRHSICTMLWKRL